MWPFTKKLQPVITQDDLDRVRKEVNDSQHLPTISLSNIDTMEERKGDLAYQYDLCLDMMRRGELLPFPFERAVILLRKEKRYQDELAICDYTAAWAAKNEPEHLEGAMIWKSPSIQRVIARRAKLLELMGKDLKS